MCCWNRDGSTLRSTAIGTVALDQDSRKPASLAPLLWNNWVGLTAIEARAGDFAAAEKSLKASEAAIKATETLEQEGSQRRVLFDLVIASVQSRFDLVKGSNQAAFDLAMQTASQLRNIDLSNWNPVAHSGRHDFP